jgi:hypothetical protein
MWQRRPPSRGGEHPGDDLTALKEYTTRRQIPQVAQAITMPGDPSCRV